MSQWTVPAERAKMCSIIYSGCLFGTIFGTTAPALIIRYTGMGWPGVFYIFGVIGVVWFPFWALFCYNSPDEHPFISETERNYLEGSLKEQKHKNPPPSPLKCILRSRPFWALLLAIIGSDWSYFAMTSDLPKYMRTVVGFSIESNGYISCLPYLTMWFCCILSYWIGDKILKKQLMTLTNTRKLFTVISLIGPACFIVGASYVEHDHVLVVLIFVFGITLMGFAFPSIMTNTLDLSPNYSDILMSLANGVATISATLSPYIIEILITNQTIAEWRLVFWIIFGIALVAAVQYVINGNGEIQAWNDSKFLRDTVTMTKKKNDDINDEKK